MTVKNKKNTGDASQDLFQATMESLGKSHSCYKLIDTKEIKGLSKSGFVRKAPSDFIVSGWLMPAGMAYCEVKSCSDPVSFSFTQFTQGQWIGITKAAATGMHGHYLVFIHRLPENEWYILTANEIIDQEKLFNRRSFKWTEMKRAHRFEQVIRENNVK